MIIYPAKKAQITLLLAKNITLLAEYLDLANVFLEKSANIFPKQTRIYEHTIKLKKCKQPPYRPIYSLKLVKSKTLKTYLEINLANSFIIISKLPAGALILFVYKLNNSLCLCVNYQGLNNLTIKNWYPLILIRESLNWLGQVKQFNQLNLITAYYQMRIKKDNK